ncbi:MAG: DoxX family membrane protein [Terracidiphilus sp.]|jgi:uncharacterized membrane protein YkgB
MTQQIVVIAPEPSKSSTESFEYHDIPWHEHWYHALCSELRKWGVIPLRVTLGAVFLWFGVLKIAGVSPVVSMIQTAFPFMPEPYFIQGLGAVEVLIGLGLTSGIALRLALPLFLFQMGGTFIAPLMAPSLFFAKGNLLMLTSDGEFVVKNLVLVTAGLVVAAYELKPLRGVPAREQSA